MDKGGIENNFQKKSCCYASILIDELLSSPGVSEAKLRLTTTTPTTIRLSHLPPPTDRPIGGKGKLSGRAVDHVAAVHLYRRVYSIRSTLWPEACAACRYQIQPPPPQKRRKRRRRREGDRLQRHAIAAPAGALRVCIE